MAAATLLAAFSTAFQPVAAQAPSGQDGTGQPLRCAEAANIATPLPRAVLSEVRAYGPGGAEDSFVEVRNTTDEPLSVEGWSVRFRSGGRVVEAPLGARTIPPQGHLLLAGRRYSLAAYARPDGALPSPIASGVRLHDAGGKAVDAVGSAPEASSQGRANEQGRAAGASSPGLFHEGRGLPTWAFAPAPPAAATAGASGRPAARPQFACVRRRERGQALDPPAHRRAWLVVAASGALGSARVRLGAPGPQSLASSRLAVGPLAKPPGEASPRTVAAPGEASSTGEGSAQVQPAAEPAAPKLPARLSPLRQPREVGANQARGTLVLRARLTNETARPLRRFRLHVTGATSGPSAEGIADLRLLPLPAALKKDAASAQPAVGTPRGGSLGAPANGVGASPSPPSPRRGAAPILYGVLDEPPAQALGGGLNSSVTFTAPAGGIAPGESVELRLLLGVARAGRYRLALEGGSLRLAFNGHTERRGAPETELAWGASQSSSTQAGGERPGSEGERGSGPGRRAAGPQEGEEEQATILAAIILEGHTEDGVVPPPAKSPLALSGSQIAGDGGIRLRFIGPLDADSVEGARFTVTVNGREVEATASASNTLTIQLRLPDGALKSGDNVTVRWDNLLDPQGRVVSGQVGPVRVP